MEDPKPSAWKRVRFLATYALYIVLVLVVIDVIVMRYVLDYGHYRQRDHIHRYPAPYVMFSGTPNVNSHNELGYRGQTLQKASERDLKIAFFGGSTGYLGNPTIAETLERELGKRFANVFVANYSAFSANHRQHLHGIVEYLHDVSPDIVIFYGGYNEFIPPFHWDPRPGYPYNYYYREETSPFIQLLMRNSAIFGLLDRRYGFVSRLSELRDSVQVQSDEWQRALEDKYFETLSIANRITRGFSSKHCGTTQFVAFYQPFKVEDRFAATHARVRRRVASLDYGFDVSSELDTTPTSRAFYDHVHLTPQANEQMARRLAALLIEAIDAGSLQNCKSALSTPSRT